MTTEQLQEIKNLENDMRQYVNSGDPEVAHGEADWILVQALLMLDEFEELVALYEEVPKWYA